jgi:colanic acid biosynthesis glycosyl transferase WcaI
VRIACISPYYEPDLGPSAPLLSALCRSLAERGHEVTVIAAVPHYETGAVPKVWCWRAWWYADQDGVGVYRVWVPSGSRKNLLHRAYAFACFQVIAGLLALTVRCDVALVLNPAIETAFPFFALRLRRRPVMWGVWDLYPDIGVRLGVFRHASIATLVGLLENVCIRSAARVQALSNRFVEPLVARGGSVVTILPWLTRAAEPAPRVNGFSASHELDGRFVILYAGNLAPTHGLATVLDAAEMLPAGDYHFLFVGDGLDRESLMELAASKKLANVQFLPFQPRHAVPDVLATADVALVTVAADVGEFVFPSKLFPLLSASRPVIVSAPAENDAAAVVRASGAGVVVPPGDAPALARAIERMREDHAARTDMGRAGRAFVIAHHSLSVATDRFESELEALGGPPAGPRCRALHEASAP